MHLLRFLPKKHLSFNAQLRSWQEFYNLGPLPVMILVITPFIGFITPSYPFVIRPFIGAITPFIPGRSPSSSSQPTMAPSEDGRLPQGFAPELLPAIEAGFWKTFFGGSSHKNPTTLPETNIITVDGRNPHPWWLAGFCPSTARTWN